MANIIDYLHWRGDLTFEVSPFNEVDSLILSALAYVEFDEIAPSVKDEETVILKDCYKLYMEKHIDIEAHKKVSFVKNTPELFKPVANSVRFGNILVGRFVNRIDYQMETQFSAVTFFIDEETIYVAFRGTDNSIVGWKEDFNMSFSTPVPGQRLAEKYLQFVVSKNHKKIMIGGHSKGGNLAVYSAAMADEDIKKRIIAVYNNDGPGFSKDFVKGENYQSVLHVVDTYLPQSSVIGMIFEHEEDFFVVKSNQVGILQHDPLTWEVEGKSFIYVEALTNNTILFNKTLKSWTAAMDTEKRRHFVEALFGMLEMANAKTLEDLVENKWIVIKSISDLDEDTKKLLFETFGVFLKESNKNIRGAIAQLVTEKAHRRVSK
ncbi:MAG: DUF2974 domain-containing protein [Anaerotignaceae bacterium]